MHIRYGLPAISFAAVFLMAFTSSDSSSKDESSKEPGEEEISSPYETTGVVKRCIRLSQTGSPEPVNDRLFVFRATDQKLYQNKVSKGCNKADSPFRRIQIDVRSGMLCRGEIISVVDNGDGITAGFCRLADFEEVTGKPR